MPTELIGYIIQQQAAGWVPSIAAVILQAVQNHGLGQKVLRELILITEVFMIGMENGILADQEALLLALPLLLNLLEMIALGIVVILGAGIYFGLVALEHGGVMIRLLELKILV